MDIGTMWRWLRAACAVSGALLMAMSLTSCGAESDASSSGQAAAHNDADVAFASHMILHHQQAVQMAGIAGWQATRAEVKKAATAIKSVQEPEMRLMSAWLTGWGEPVPSPSHSGHEMEDAIPGMMTEEEIHELGKAKGTRFDRIWIQMMIRHHQGAVAMAKTQQTSGNSPEALALAKKIETTHTSEITTLKRFLGQVPVR